MTDKVQKIREGVEKLKSQLIRGSCSSQIAMETRCKEEAYNEVISLLDSLQEEPEPQFKVGDTIRSKHWNTAVHKIISMDNKSYCLDNGGKVDLPAQQLWELVEEPVSEDFKKFEEQYLEKEKDEIISVYDRHAGLVDGAQWQKEHLWKPADGDDLPEIDREVIVLIKYNAQRNIHDDEYPTYRVGFGHRPNPNGWNGKNLDTGEVTHYEPKLYDKGGWNAPDIVYWLDIELPKEIEP